MHPLKKYYAEEVLKLVANNCGLLANEQEEPILDVLGISPTTAQEIINKIMIALPDQYFYNATAVMLPDILNFIVKCYILFECQESQKDDLYAHNLINFISNLSVEIDERYYSGSE